jgi:replication factor C subunit 1
VFDLSFRRPQANEVRSRIMTIAFREGLKLTPNVIDQFVEGTHSDIRQILNLLSTYRLSKTELAFDDSKKVYLPLSAPLGPSCPFFVILGVNGTRVKDAEKYIILKPWDIAGRYLSGGMFHPNSKTTLNEKIELYFNDFEFSSLMIQENYLKLNPDLARNVGNTKEQKLKALELAEKAAESISNGDLVDAMIHGYPSPQARRLIAGRNNSGR